jgi:hypothetical protein
MSEPHPAQVPGHRWLPRRVMQREDGPGGSRGRQCGVACSSPSRWEPHGPRHPRTVDLQQQVGGPGRAHNLVAHSLQLQEELHRRGRQREPVLLPSKHHGASTHHREATRAAALHTNTTRRAHSSAHRHTTPATHHKPPPPPPAPSSSHTHLDQQRRRTGHVGRRCRTLVPEMVFTACISPIRRSNPLPSSTRVRPARVPLFTFCVHRTLHSRSHLHYHHAHFGGGGHLCTRRPNVVRRQIALASWRNRSLGYMVRPGVGR